jgi:hypothetical protein
MHLRPAGSQLIDLHLTGVWAVSHGYKAGAALMCAMSARTSEVVSDRCCNVDDDSLQAALLQHKLQAHNLFMCLVLGVLPVHHDCEVD